MNEMTKKINRITALAQTITSRTIRQVRYSTNKDDFLNIRRDILLAGVRKHIPTWLKKDLKSMSLSPAINDDESDPERLIAFERDDTVKLTTIRELHYSIEQCPSLRTRRKHKDGSTITLQERLEKSARRALKYGVGNCGELSTISFLHFLEYKDSNIPERVRLERAYLARPGDHAFVIINRQINSNLNDLLSWGNAIICDPWKGVSLDVKSQMQKDPKERDHIFEYIRSHQIKIQHSSYIGAGHSPRFYAKNRLAIDQHPDQKSEEELNFNEDLNLLYMDSSH